MGEIFKKFNLKLKIKTYFFMRGAYTSFNPQFEISTHMNIRKTSIKQKRNNFI